MHQKHQTFLFIIITLFLGSCNNAPQETIVETNTDSTATKIDTTTKVVEQPTIPALKAPP